MLGGLIFDFDGLILDTETPEFVSVSEVFAAHGCVIEDAWWRSIIGSTDHPHWFEVLAAQLETMGIAMPDREIVVEARLARHHALIADEVVRPGVVALLDAAVDAGVPVAVASSSSRNWVAGHLERLGLLEHFVYLATGDSVPRSKPAPDLYLAALRALHADPGRVVALEDSVNGVTAARAAGIAVVAVPGPMTIDHDFTAASKVVASLEDLTLADLTTLLS